MMDSPRRLLALTALTVGVAGGTAAALATAAEEPERPPARPDGVVVVRAEPPPEPRRPSGDLPLVIEEGDVALEARVPDPRGGPDWAVRTFVGEARRVALEDRSFGDTETIARARCVQLGRIVDGVFGWVDAQQRFRAVRPDADGGVLERSPMVRADGTAADAGAPLRCAPVGREPEAFASLETLIDDPTDGATAPVATVAWGLAADPSAEQVELGGLPEGTRSVRLGEPRGAFVVPAGPEVRAEEVTASFDGDEPVSLAYEVSLDGGRPDLVEGTSRVEVRAPDPAGGPAWGAVTARSEAGGWCVGEPARFAGDRLGGVDLGLGTFTEARAPSDWTCPSPRLSRGEPLELRSTICGGGPPDSDASFGRVALRTLPGTCTISGIAHRDVRLITVVTERGVRTLSPSQRAGAFLTVFDGAFPAGPIEVTATLADGSEVTERVETTF